MKKFVAVHVVRCLVFLLVIAACSPNTQKARYNVLFIAVDDLRRELNCYGATHIQSPNIDRLAAASVVFTNAHIQQAICMASRASIMTGYRPERFGIYTGESVTDLVPDALTLNKLFEQNGYAIAAFGKVYHFGSDHSNQFGDRHMDPTYRWAGRGYLLPESVEKMLINESIDIPGRNHENRGPAFEWADVQDSAYIDGYNTECALQKLEEFAQADQPFFMAVGFHKPHLPFVAPKKYWDMYPYEQVGLPQITDPPTHSNKYTLRSWGELRNYYGMPKYRPQPVGEDTTRILRQGYYACVTYVDALIGKLLDRLQKLDLSDKTIIVLWGDHGYKLGDYGYWCKWSNMDIDTRIPLIIHLPAKTHHAKVNVPVEALDLYPTLAELCGLQVPAHVEGQSLRPLLEGQEQQEDRYAYSIWPHNRTRYEDVVMGYSVKTPRFNYVEWVDLSTGEVLERELYDHLRDSMETVNVIADERYALQASSLAARCLERRQATDHDHAFHREDTKSF